MRLLASLVAIVLAFPAAAQETRSSHCIALAEAPGLAYVHRAAFGAPLPDFTARISYVGHATFLIEAPDGATMATDYTGYLGATDHVPTVVTMNKAHGTHFTNSPDPRIPHVLRGWNEANDGTPARHNIQIGDTVVRNVPTDIRRGFGAVDEPNANSIFVFEVAGLCIAHLGHIHTDLTDSQYAALGRMDIIMAPVDGGYTIPLPTMVSILQRARASIVIPMHWFSLAGLERFVQAMDEAEYAVELRQTNSVEVSLRSLPSQPTVMVLRPQLLSDEN